MKNQFNIFNNQSRESKLDYLKHTKLNIALNEEVEYLSKSGKVVSVTKKSKVISTGKRKAYYQIMFEGELLQPLTSKGVLNYINNK